MCAQINLSGSVSSTGSPILGAYLLVLGSDANHTLTPTEYTNNFIRVTSGVSLTATRNLVVPTILGQSFVIQNSTSGGQELQLIGTLGTGIIIPNGGVASVVCDNTNYISLGGGTSGNGGNYFVFSPGGVGGANVYTSFSALSTAISPLTGRVTIYVDGSNVNNVIAVPNGTYAMPVSVEFSGIPITNTSGPEGQVYPSINFGTATGFIPHPYEITFTNLIITSTNNDSVPGALMNVNDGYFVINVRDSTVSGSSFYPLVAATNSTVIVNTYGDGAIESNSGYCITADSASHSIINMYDGSAIVGSTAIDVASNPTINLYSPSASLDPSFLSTSSTITYPPEQDVEVVFQDGGPDVGTSFGIWSKLVKYLADVKPTSKVKIYVSSAYIGSGPTIPPGTYAMPYALEFIGLNTPLPGSWPAGINYGYPTLTFNPTNVSTLTFNPPPTEVTQTNIALVSYSSNPIITITGENTYTEASNFNYVMRGIVPAAQSSLVSHNAAFVALDGYAIANLDMYDLATTSSSDDGVFSIDATSQLYINLYDGANLAAPDFPIASGGTVFINYASSGARIHSTYTTNPAVLITYLAPAPGSSYPGILQPVTFQPGGTYTSLFPNVVVDQGALTTLLNEILQDTTQPLSPVTTYMDFSQVSGTYTATGTMHFGAYVQGIYGWDYPLFHGGAAAITSATPGVLNTGTHLLGTVPLEIRDMSIVTVSGGFDHVFTGAPAYIKFSGNSLMSITGDGTYLFKMAGNTSIVDLFGGVTFGDGTHALVSVDATSSLTINVYDKVHITANAFSITAGGTVTINVLSSSASVHASYVSTSGVTVNYTVILQPLVVKPDTVNTAASLNFSSGDFIGFGDVSANLPTTGFIRVPYNAGTGHYLTMYDGGNYDLVALAGSVFTVGNASWYQTRVVSSSATFVQCGSTYILVQAGSIDIEGVTTSTTTPSAGGAGVLPVTPAGYMTVTIDGVSRQIAYY